MQAPHQFDSTNGMAFGSGFELAIVCDFIIVPDKAKDLNMLGEPIGAAEAAHLGIAVEMHHVVGVTPFLFLTDDVKEGVTTFHTKRNPKFK